MHISKSSASQRAKRGWVTRRQKGGRAKIGVQVRPGRSNYLATQIVGGKINDAAANSFHQYTWKRPNGDHVKVTGFTHKDMRRMKPVLGRIDNTLGAQHHLDVSIEKRALPIPVRVANLGLGAGLSMYTKEEQMKRIKQAYRDKEGRPMTRAEERLHHGILTLQGHKDHTRIMVTPMYSHHKNFQFIVAHELGHAVDQNDRISKTKEWRKAAKWKKDAKDATGVAGALSNTAKGHEPGYKGGNYQGISPSEDFAETFAQSVLKNRVPDIVNDKRRQQYFKEHVNRNTPLRNPKPDVHRHVNYPALAGGIYGAWLLDHKLNR